MYYCLAKSPVTLLRLFYRCALLCLWVCSKMISSKFVSGLNENLYWNWNLRGHCLLFSTGVWRGVDGQLDVHWASQGYCNYTIFVGVMLGLVATIQIYRLSVFLYKGTDSSFLSAFVDVIIGIFLCTGAIISACMITFGFMAWCQTMEQRFPS